MIVHRDPYEVLMAELMIKTWDRCDLLFPQQFPPVHLAQDGKPYCQLGGFNLRNWKQISASVLRMNICGRCLIRKEAQDRRETTDAEPGRPAPGGHNPTSTIEVKHG